MKKEKVERFAVPESLTDRFMGVVYSMVGPFGVDKVPEAMHFLELTGQALEKSSAGKEYLNAPDRTHMERKRFISIFKSRYLHAMDYEYTRSITPVDGKLMGQTVSMLSGLGFDVSEFLEWLFDSFLKENEKFCPPTIKWTCSQFVTERFMFENKDKMKSRRQENQAAADAEGVVNRARVQIRLMRTRGDKDGIEKMVERLKAYRDQRIMLEELRAHVEELESAVPEGGSENAEG